MAKIVREVVKTVREVVITVSEVVKIVREKIPESLNYFELIHGPVFPPPRRAHTHY